MGLDERLRRLEKNQPPEHCPKCHGQMFAAYVRGENPPEPCSKCGKLPPFIVETPSTAGVDMVMRIASGELPQPRTRDENEEKGTT